ncbi:putative tRNA N6-adenosine threonylcarbamoyltransferase, mitochondrial [Perkinsus olseni]|uniref:Putative tRNA N6-adenosine threonylcarbamoyltransferase, mitochondrial n=1 Tax=Perkinsus olseni TaxID=32597 RepID=A0A7J6QTF0_PEROL|nr:putative tRNA N6-adenosine threonylcarbamoyltransferase, mitochondrial [Perkinsus olseni]
MRQLIEGGKYSKPDMAATFQKRCVDHLVERAGRAIDWAMDLDGGIKDLVVAGGVAANMTVRSSMQELAKEKGLTLHCPPTRLCTDNGTMVAWNAIEHLKKGLYERAPCAAESAEKFVEVRPRWPLGPRDDRCKGRDNAEGGRKARKRPQPEEPSEEQLREIKRVAAENARLTFQDRTAALADQPPTTSSGSFELAFHSRQSLETLKRIGPFETEKLLKCFGLEPRTRASTFASDLYACLSLVKPPMAFFCTQLIFCQTEDIGLVVGIGRNLDKNSKLESFDYGFKLELKSAKETAALPKEGGRKRVPPLRIRIAPRKRPREAEEVSAAMSAHRASSPPGTGDLQVHYVQVSASAEDAASPPFEDVKKAVDSPPSKLNAGAPPGDGLLDLPLE